MKTWHDSLYTAPSGPCPVVARTLAGGPVSPNGPCYLELLACSLGRGPVSPRPFRCLLFGEVPCVSVLLLLVLLGPCVCRALVPWCFVLWSMSNTFRLLMVLSWNVRDLGDSDMCDVVHDTITSASPTIWLSATSRNQGSMTSQMPKLPRSCRLHSQTTSTIPGCCLELWLCTHCPERGVLHPNLFHHMPSHTPSSLNRIADFHLTITNVYVPLDNHDSLVCSLEGLLERSTFGSTGFWLGT